LEVPTAEALDVVYEPPEGYLFALAGEFVPKAETEWQHRRDGWNSEGLKRTPDKAFRHSIMDGVSRQTHHLVVPRVLAKYALHFP